MVVEVQLKSPSVPITELEQSAFCRTDELNAQPLEEEFKAGRGAGDATGPPGRRTILWSYRVGCSPNVGGADDQASPQDPRGVPGTDIPGE